MGKADEYRQRAHEADKQARAAINGSTRVEFERLGNNWRELARQAEELDRMDRSPGLDFGEGDASRQDSPD